MELLEQCLLKTVSRYVKDECIRYSNQHGFTGGRGRERDIFLLEFCKAFDTVLNKMVVVKLLRNGLSKPSSARPKNSSAGAACVLSSNEQGLLGPGTVG